MNLSFMVQHKFLAIICMLLIIFGLPGICFFISLILKSVWSKKALICNIPSEGLIRHATKYNSLSLHSNHYTRNGRLVYLNEHECKLDYGCTAVPTSNKTFDLAAHCFEIDPKTNMKLYGMDLYDNIGNVIRIPRDKFTFVKHKNFDFTTRVNDYARITLLTSKYADKIRPLSSNELVARTNQIELWLSQEIGNFETKREDVTILNMTDCKSRFPKTERIWQALDRSEKEEVEALICAEHNDVIMDQGNSGTLLMTVRGNSFVRSTLSSGAAVGNNSPSIFTSFPENDDLTDS